MELDLSSGGLALHLKRYVQILGEQLTVEDEVEMSSLSLLAGITGAIKACHDVAYDMAIESSIALSAYSKYEEQIVRLKRDH